MTDYDVSFVNDNMMEFHVNFFGPLDSPYEGGCWRVRCELPEAYPYKSPSIAFLNKIYHPNIDELYFSNLFPKSILPPHCCRSGSVCLDVINQKWSSMFDLLNVFESFLPQLLMYPNPTDPLNGEAAALLIKEPEQYTSKIKDYIKKFATKEAMLATKKIQTVQSSSESELSDDFNNSLG